MALSIHPLDLGDIELDQSFLTWQTGCGQKVWAPTTGWLLLGGEKPVLVDSSFRSVEDAAALQGLRCRRSPEQSLEAQLGKHGVGLADVGVLIYTHLHMDHAGQDFLLPNARILLQRRELQNAAAPNFFPVPFYDRQNIARLVGEQWHRVDLLDGPGEILPGVRTVLAPGHTPAHQMLYVETAGGTAIIAGDSAMDLEANVRRGVPPGIVDCMAETLDSLRLLAREDRTGKRVLPTHDATVFRLYPDGILS